MCFVSSNVNSGQQALDVRIFISGYYGQQEIMLDPVVNPSHLLNHTNHKRKETAYNVLHCYDLCTVLLVLIYTILMFLWTDVVIHFNSVILCILPL